jgi:uncharacterized protein (DUF169 family)
MLKELYAAIDRYVRPLSQPVAVKVMEREESILKARVPTEAFGHRMAICQGIALTRRFGWKIAFHERDWGCPVGMSLFGFGGPRSPEMDGAIACPLYTSTPEAGVVLQNAMPQFPSGAARTVVMATLDRADFDPDVIIIYGMPFQIARCIQGAQWEDGNPIVSEFSGRANCAYEIITPIQTGTCRVIIPGGGEKAFAGTQDCEMSFAVPAQKGESFAKGLEATHKAGANRIPTPSLGIMAEPMMPPQYNDLARFLGIGK